MLTENHEQSQNENSFENGLNQTTNTKLSNWKLLRLSAVVCGIELCYAAETAFSSPILLGLGFPTAFMTLIWGLSPLFGFFLVPVLGSLSDKCSSRFGRRRPFIFLYSIGIILGIILIGNGRRIGELFGDASYRNGEQSNSQSVKLLSKHKISTLFTITGVVLLDLNSDACQSPSRAYLLEVTDPSQHCIGLTTFTWMAGLGGCFGYFLAGIPWEQTLLTYYLGEHTRVLFTLIAFIYVICAILTLTAEEEHIPGRKMVNNSTKSISKQNDISTDSMTSFNKLEVEGQNNVYCETEEDFSIKHYLHSIIFMPASLRWLCLTNFFCWMALISYSLFFTDFVGQAVFGGDPSYDSNHPSRILYNNGVRFGSWGMSVYSISCSIYSINIEYLNNHFGMKRVYIGSQLIYAVGMLLMGCFRHRLAVIVLSSVAGILYSTVLTTPYLLISQYYSSDTFKQLTSNSRVRGLGTDVAVVSGMIFLAQFCLSSSMGTVIYLANSTVVITIVASFLSICGAISATRILYL